MARVTLRPMTATEFDEWFARSTRGYARDLARAYGRPEAEADSDADGAARRMLPDGRDTAGHQFLRVVADDVDSGWLWLGPPDDGALWIYDIEIAESERGRGIGTATLRAAEDVARSLRMRALALNVFGHNPRARALYEAVGYETVTTQMRKPLPD